MRTVGDILQEARLRAGKSLEEVEKATKIRRSILEAIEKGQYDKLPPSTFIKGFIRNYGSYLGLNSSELLAFFRREFDDRKAPAPLKNLSLKKPRFQITTGVVVVAFISLVLAGVSLYLFAQYRSFTGAPLLTINEPRNNLKTSASEVLVAGRTYSDSTLKINGQQVELSPGGAFSVAVALVDGINELVITSSNSFGKIATEKRTVIVENNTVANVPVASSSASVNQDFPVNLTLKIGPSSSWVHVEIDGNLSFEGVLVNGSTRTFQAKEVIKVITGNGGSTKVTVNNGNEEIMGSEGQRVEKEYKK